MTADDPIPSQRLTPGPVLGLIAVFMLIPVTLPVPVLRGLVHDRFGVSEFATSVFMSINMVAALLAAPVAGAIADRRGRRKGMLVGALCVDGAMFAAMTTDLPFAAFLACRFVEGAAHITALSLLLSAASDTARLRGSGRTMGFVGGGLTLGVALGAPLGGVLGRVDPLRPLAVGAVISLVLAGVCVAALRETRVTARRPSWAELGAVLRRSSALWVPLAYAFVDRFTVGFFTTTFPLWMKRVHELPPDRVGLLLGLFLGPFALLSYPFGRLAERRSRIGMLAGGSALYGVLLILLGTFDLEVLPGVMVVLGVVSAVMFVPSLMLTAELAPADVRATALGAFNAAGSLGFVVGPLVGGSVSSLVAVTHGWETGYAMAFVVAGIAELLCVAVTLRALRRLRDGGRIA